MGKSYINTATNNLNLQETFNKFIKFPVVMASEDKYFYKKPVLSEVLSIDIEDNNKSCILRLKNDGFIVLEKVIKWADHTQTD